MLAGRIRPVETRELTLEAPTIAQARADAEAQIPEGWVITDAEPSMPKASVMITLHVKLARRDGVTDIEADDLDSLEAKVPEGWQLLSVREI